jgi:hypothetical protein
MGRYILRITDGTDAIDIGHTDINGISLDDGYRFGIPQPKDGGVFQNSSLTEGQRLTYLRLDDVEETYTIAITGSDQDEIIYTLSELFRLLQKANDYWLTNWQNDPVWIERRSRCETGTQYATIKFWQVSELPNVYAEPFDTASELYRLDFFDLLIRHEIWRGHEPGEGDCVEYRTGRDSTDRFDTCNPVYIANKTNQEIDMLIYYWDDSAGTWTDATPGVIGNPSINILPLFPGVDDIILIGCNSTNTYPLFSSVVFNIETAQSGPIQFQWKYSKTGTDPLADWANLSITDNTATTNSFDNSGQLSIHFDQPGDWAQFNANPGAAVGTTTYWIAAVVTAAPAGSTPPYIEGDIDVYTISWPYIEVQADQLSGDLPSLLWHVIRDVSYSSSALDNASERLIFGSRSVERGENFNAFINISDEQQPSNITLLTSGTASLTSEPRSITGTIGLIQLSNAVFQIIIDNPLSLDYIGVFRLFLRMSRVGASSGTLDVNVTFDLSDDDRNVFHSVTRKFPVPVALAGNLTPLAYDFGLVSILQDQNINNLSMSSLSITITFTGTPVVWIYLYDIILIPADEFSYEIQGGSRSDSNPIPMDEVYFDLNGFIPKTPLRSILREIGGEAFNETDDVKYLCRPPLSSDNFKLQSSKKQRIWFLLSSLTTDVVVFPWGTFNVVLDISLHEQCISLQSKYTSRYLSLRGRS